MLWNKVLVKYRGTNIKRTIMLVIDHKVAVNALARACL